jgi:hypothetical protein
MRKATFFSFLICFTFHLIITLSAFSQTGFSRHTISASLGGAYWVYAADVDRDGDKDLVTASGNGIDWWSNSGGNFSRRSVGSLNGAWSAYAADVDDDGDIDIMGVSPGLSHTVLWVNNGSQSFSRILVDDSELDPESVVAADCDGDGDMEIVVAAWESEHVVVYENNGRNSFSKQIIDSSLPGAHTVQIGDFDRDGDMDIAACGASKTRWYRNGGNNSFSRSDIGGGALGIFAFDVDRDGDLDILQTARNGSIVWFRNNGGGFSGNTVESGYGDSWSISAGDMDGDGDIDIAAAGYSANNVKVWWNSGNQNFNSSSIVENVNTVRGVHVDDYDRDGDADIAAAIKGDNDLVWYEASGSGSNNNDNNNDNDNNGGDNDDDVVVTGGTRVEAEDMSLNGYVIEEQGGHYSGNDGIKLATSSGKAQFVFSGQSGNYDIYVHYQDEDDGQSTLEVRVDGSLVDSWRLDIDDGELYTRRVASAYNVSNGDLIEITGIRNGGEFARIDYVQLSGENTGNNDNGGQNDDTNTGGDNNGGVVTGGGLIEAEEMALSGYVVEEQGGHYSNNDGIKLSGSSGKAQVVFGGQSGSYDIYVRYEDEDDGQSTLEVRVDGSLVDSWRLNIDDSRLYTRQVASGYSLSSGDLIEITGIRNGGEFARVDYVQFGGGSSGDTDNDNGGNNNNDGGDVNVSGLFVEAEDMSLSNFIVEDDKGGGYSEGAVIKLDAKNGTASVIFGAASGNYTLNLRYLDEPDGPATIEVRIGGTVVDSWSLNLNDNELHTRAIDVHIDNGDQVVLAARKNSGEFARIDYIEFVPDGLSKGAIAAAETALPAAFALRQNYPNPFNPSTTIEYALPEETFVILGVFNMRGQLVRQLVSSQESAGQKRVTWFGDDETGAAMSSGVYFVRLEAGHQVLMRTMVLAR